MLAAQGGTISIARIVRSAPDGYTIGMGTLGQYVISGAVYTLPFDMLADLTPVALLPNVPCHRIAPCWPCQSLRRSPCPDWLSTSRPLFAGSVFRAVIQ
jgi:hypothetical protein